MQNHFTGLVDHFHKGMNLQCEFKLFKVASKVNLSIIGKQIRIKIAACLTLF